MSYVESERVVSLLKDAIRLSNFTYRDVERQLGWRVGTITRLLRGGLGLKVENLLAILHVIDFSPGRFFAAAFPPAAGPSPIEERLARMLEQLHGPLEGGSGAALAVGFGAAERTLAAPIAGTSASAGVSGTSGGGPSSATGPANSGERGGGRRQDEIDEMVRDSLRRLLAVDGSEPPVR